MSDMKKCPVCSEPMDVERRYGIEVDVCRAHGVWLDNGELARLTLAVRKKQDSDAGEARAELPHDPGAAPRIPKTHQPCAVCGKRMLAKPVYGQTIGVCTIHGYWLDKAALAGIVSVAREKQPASGGGIPVISDVADIVTSDGLAWELFLGLMGLIPWDFDP